MIDIAENLSHIRDAIAAAARRSGRAPEAVKLIAVSKTHPPDTIQAAIAAGQRVFGESTVQESLAKIEHFAHHALEWHFIGHLQSNKTKFVPGHFAWLHSLDSVKLAQRLSATAREKQTALNALIEVNVTKDPNKHGVTTESLFSLLDQLQRTDVPFVALRGLMTIGPHQASEAELRTVFATVRRLLEQSRERFDLPAFDQLSIGMSDDYLIGIEEGATLVRVGTAIFGARDYGNG